MSESEKSGAVDRESGSDASAPEVALHVIPVPRGWSAEQAWEAIQRGDLLTDEQPSWSVVRAEAERFVRLIDLGGD